MKNVPGYESLPKERDTLRRFIIDLEATDPADPRIPQIKFCLAR